MFGFTLFTGAGGVDLGMRRSGITPIGGIEYDDKIAQVARDNGLYVTTANILQCSPSMFERPNLLHASPPCPNFSTAKTNATESENDIALANKVVEFLTVWQPEYFTLENVWLYRKSVSWSLILDCLYSLGYGVAVDRVNFANYGVPQTRVRMFVRAVLGSFFVPSLPASSPWVGWGDSLRDLFHTFPVDSFPSWQCSSFPALPSSFIVNGSLNNFGKSLTVRDYSSPSFTILASCSSKPIRGLFSGSVFRLTPRAVARLQSFPDCYSLPSSPSLSFRLLGNAVPPLGYSVLVSGLFLN